MRKLIHATICGLLLTFWLWLLLKIAFETQLWYLFVPVFLLVSYLIYLQKSVKLIWRRALIFLSIESFLMPVAGAIGTLTSSAVKSGKFEFVFGGLIAGGVVTVILAIAGFSLGIIFLLIGLLVFRIPKKK